MAEAEKFKSLVRTSLAIGEMEPSNPGQIKLASLAGMRRRISCLFGRPFVH